MNINWLNTKINNLPRLLSSLILVFFLGTALPAHSQKLLSDSTNSIPSSLLKEPNESINLDSLLNFAKSYLGTPYRRAGKSSKGFDCSGFVHHVYKNFNVKVPYSCPGISAVCRKKIKKDEVEKGDLLFFKGSNSHSKAIGHIAIVYAVTDGGIQMIHACQRGVIIDKLNESKYYKTRFLFAKRIL
jgi:cell wall-associated NlpC family hydrolase